MHKRIRYNDDAQIVRLEFPWEVSVGAPAAVNLEVKNRAGTAITADAATDLIASDTTTAAWSAGDTDGSITTGKSYAAGDRVRIAGVTPELATVKSYTASTKKFTFVDPLLYDHATGVAITPWFTTDVLDTSTVANYEEGLLVTLIWTPYDSTPDLFADAYEETGQVLIAGFDIPTLLMDVRAMYPNEFRIIEEDVPAIESLARDRLAGMVAARGYTLEMVREPDAFREVMAHLMAMFAGLRGGDAGSDNVERAWKQASERFELAASCPIWVDADQDETEDEDEEIADFSYTAIGPGRCGSF